MVDLIGWSGAILLLIAYALVSGKYMGGTSIGYQLLNIAGAVLLIVNSSYYGAYPSAILNLVWVAIASVAIIRTSAKTSDSACFSGGFRGFWQRF